MQSPWSSVRDLMAPPRLVRIGMGVSDDMGGGGPEEVRRWCVARRGGHDIER